MKKRNLKKVIKKSNGFLSIIRKDGIVFPANEWQTITFVRYGLKISHYDVHSFISYTSIKKVITEG